MSWRARLSKSLNELRIVYCPNTPSSIGTREFVKKYYTDLKVLNPGLPIYIRPADDIEPHVAARYARGVYEVQSTSDKSADQVLAVVQELEAAAPAINNRNTGGIGGDKFKIADVV